MRSRARAPRIPRKLLRGQKLLDGISGEEIYQRDASTRFQRGMYMHKKNYDYLTTQQMEEMLQDQLASSGISYYSGQGIETPSYSNLPVYSGDAEAIANGYVLGMPYLLEAGIDQYTDLLLHLDNNFTDSSSNNLTVTNTNVTFSNSVYEFGGYSGVFNGTNSFLTVPQSSLWTLGANNFTWDLWVNPSQITTPEPTLLGQFINSNNFILFIETLGSLIFSAKIAGTFIASYQTLLPVVAANVWQHIALVRNGSQLSMYVNGVSQILNILDAISNKSVGSLATTFNIGGTGQALSKYQGYLDEVRISNGVARWTSNFIPPTAPYTNTQTFVHVGNV